MALPLSSTKIASLNRNDHGGCKRARNHSASEIARSLGLASKSQEARSDHRCKSQRPPPQVASAARFCGCSDHRTLSFTMRNRERMIKGDWKTTPSQSIQKELPLMVLNTPPPGQANCIKWGFPAERCISYRENCTFPQKNPISCRKMRFSRSIMQETAGNGTRNKSGTKKRLGMAKVQTNIGTNNSEHEGTTDEDMGFRGKKGQKVHPNFAANIAMEFHCHTFCAPEQEH